MGRTQRYRSFETNGKMKYSLDTRLQCYIALNTQMAGMHITQTNQAQTARYRPALRQYSIKHEEGLCLVQRHLLFLRMNPHK